MTGFESSQKLLREVRNLRQRRKRGQRCRSFRGCRSSFRGGRSRLSRNGLSRNNLFAGSGECNADLVRGFAFGGDVDLDIGQFQASERRIGGNIFLNGDIDRVGDSRFRSLIDDIDDFRFGQRLFFGEVFFLNRFILFLNHT